MQFLVVSFVKLNIKPVLAVRNDIVINQQPTHPPFRPLQKNKIHAKTKRFEKKCPRFILFYLLLHLKLFIAVRRSYIFWKSRNFTAKHFISYHWKAIRRYSIWRSEGLATSYIAVKLGYRMMTTSRDLRKNNENKKKVFPRRTLFLLLLRLKLFIAIRRPNIFKKSRIVTFQGSFWNLNCS